MSITPTYEDEIAVANKITIAPHTDHEKTILLKVPRGKENRKKTAELLPFIVDIERLRSDEGAADFKAMVQMIGALWGQNKFEDEVLPFALQMNTDKERKYLEELSLMEAFEAFLSAAMYIVSGGKTDEAVEALKKSRGEGGESGE